MTEQLATTPPITPGEHLRAIRAELDRLPEDEAICYNDLHNFKQRVARLCEHYSELIGGAHGS